MIDEAQKRRLIKACAETSVDASGQWVSPPKVRTDSVENFISDMRVLMQLGWVPTCTTVEDREYFLKKHGWIE
jgi:hypothetical protein